MFTQDQDSTCGTNVAQKNSSFQKTRLSQLNKNDFHKMGILSRTLCDHLRSFCLVRQMFTVLSVVTKPLDRILVVRAAAALRVCLHMLLVLFMHGSDVNLHERLIGSDTIAFVSVVLPSWVSQLVSVYATHKTSFPVGFRVTGFWKPCVGLAA